jgi:sigma-B regulation protein RsbU (phosphoserine phosphatase)
MTAPSPNHLSDIPDRGRSDHLEFLAAASQILADEPSAEATLERVLADITQALDADSGSLFLFDEAPGNLICRASVGTPALPGVRIREGQGLIGRCLIQNKVETLRDSRDGGELFGSANLSLHGIRSALCAPMVASGRRVGVIVILNKRGGLTFDAQDCRLLSVMANVAALAFDRTRLAKRLLHREGVDRELDLAAEIQRNLLPSFAPGQLPVHGINRPVRQVSGDFFDYFVLPDNRIAFALGDVAGKGINAALLMAKAASLFRCLGKRNDDPATLLSIINREIHETASRGMFVTMVAGTYDPATGLVRFANGGHEPPLLRRTDRSYQTFPAETPPLGILPDMAFWTHEINLDGGELYIFSDGLMEFRYGEGEELGVEGLIQLVESLCERPLAERLQALLAELDREGWEIRDDLTVLAIDGAWVSQDLVLHHG